VGYGRTDIDRAFQHPVKGAFALAKIRTYAAKMLLWFLICSIIGSMGGGEKMPKKRRKPTKDERREQRLSKAR